MSGEDVARPLQARMMGLEKRDLIQAAISPTSSAQREWGIG
jgi:hypothetical protein